MLFHTLTSVLASGIPSLQSYTEKEESLLLSHDTLKVIQAQV